MEKRELKLILITLLLVGAIISFPLALLGWAGYQHSHSKYIHISKIKKPSYLNLTNKLNNIQSIKEVTDIANGKVELQLSVDKFVELRKLIGSSDYVRINGTTYKIHLTRAAEGSKVYNAESYTTVSREELENYTLIKSIIMSIIENEQEIKTGDSYPTYIAIQNYVSIEELCKAKEFVRERGNVIKFEGEYYEVVVETNFSLTRYQSPRCMHVTKEQLEDYPTLLKALEKASESEEGATLKTPPEEWRETNSFVRGDRVSYSGSEYKVGFSLA